MSIKQVTVNNAEVAYDDRGTNRWIDALGTDVIKYLGRLAHGRIAKYRNHGIVELPNR